MWDVPVCPLSTLGWDCGYSHVIDPEAPDLLTRDQQ